MARQIITRILCDGCMEQGLTTEITESEETPPIIIGRDKPRVLALCERHRKELYDPFVDMLHQLGQLTSEPFTPAQSATPVDGAACPLCGKGLKNRSSLQSHARTMHDMTLSEIESQDPSVQVDERWACDVEGCGANFSSSGRPSQALGVHRSRKHGIPARK